ncbi:MAG TPA: hypothetical protein VGL81_30640 [Polyangiaceae bacterium]
MSRLAPDLTPEEAARVRAAIRFLRVRTGRLDVLAKALRFERATLRRVLAGNDPVTATMVLRVARLAGVGLDEVLGGTYPPAGVCPHCGAQNDAAPGGPRTASELPIATGSEKRTAAE